MRVCECLCGYVCVRGSCVVECVNASMVGSVVVRACVNVHVLVAVSV